MPVCADSMEMRVERAFKHRREMQVQDIGCHRGLRQEKVLKVLR